MSSEPTDAEQEVDTRSTRQVRGTQLRPDFPEIMGAGEVTDCSGRATTAAVAYYRDTFEDFPRPVAIFSTGPVYVGSEIREFWRRHPVRSQITSEERQRIREAAKTPQDDEEVALKFGLPRARVAQIRRRAAQTSTSTGNQE